MSEAPPTPADEPAERPTDGAASTPVSESGTVTESGTESEPVTASGPATGAEPARVLSRSAEGRMFTGVCAGLGRYLGLDPVLLRVGFAALVLGSGIGILLYIAAFLLMREPGGRPGYLEQWTHRIFDTETVLALLAAVFAFGLMINLASGGIDTGTIVVGVVLAITLLAAHSRGVDLLALAKSMPERMTGRRGMAYAPESAFGRPRPFVPAGQGWYGMPPQGGPGGPAEARAAAQAAPPASAADVPPTAVRDASADASASADPVSRSHQTQENRMPGGQTQPGGYRRLSDLAKEAGSRAYAGATGYSSGEPFAPHGPYSTGSPYGARYQSRPYAMYDPRRSRYGMREPYQTAEPRGRRTRQKQPKSFIGGLTICLALIVGGVMASVQSTGSINLPVIGGAVLITIGAGLLVATWVGRGAGLVAAGTIVALILVAGSTLNGIPAKIGSYTWHPVNAAEAAQEYTVGIGQGELDLSDIALKSGTRARFSASVSMGRITVIVPPTARVEVHGSARLGEVQIDNRVEDGADVKFDYVLKPEVSPTGDVATLELYVKAGFGDVEVRRAA